MYAGYIRLTLISFIVFPYIGTETPPHMRVKFCPHSPTEQQIWLNSQISPNYTYTNTIVDNYLMKISSLCSERVKQFKL
jgi:hypothetical protein